MIHNTSLLSDRWSTAASSTRRACRSSGMRRLSCFMAPVWVYDGAMSSSQEPSASAPLTAWCSTHQALERVEAFGKCAKEKNGLQKVCKDARKEYRQNNREAIAARKKEHYAANREADLARSRAWRAANLEADLARKRDYYAVNRETLSAKQKEWYEANREAVTASRRAWYADNREEVLASQRPYAESHREEAAARSRAWYAVNSEYAVARQKKYGADNPEKGIAHYQKRRALKANATGSFTGDELKELFEFYDSTCLCCGQREGDISVKSGSIIKITADHVIPLALGGGNGIDNIQPLCLSCNSSKGAWHATDYRITWQEEEAV